MYTYSYVLYYVYTRTLVCIYVYSIYVMVDTVRGGYFFFIAYFYEWRGAVVALIETLKRAFDANDGPSPSGTRDERPGRLLVSQSLNRASLGPCKNTKEEKRRTTL